MWMIVAAAIGVPVAYCIWRLMIFSGPTNVARHHFILTSLGARSFAELATDHAEVVTVGGRSFPAHWIAHKCTDATGGIIVEFDAHPSRFPITISTSEFIYIRNEEHLSEIRSAIRNGEDYAEYLASEEQFERLRST